MFVLAVLTVVAAGSLGLLVRTSKICTEKMAAAFTSFPVSLVGAVLRRSSAMLAIPLKKAFCLEKREKGVEKIATEGPEAENLVNPSIPKMEVNDSCI